jgi:hypothetical protein
MARQRLVTLLAAAFCVEAIVLSANASAAVQLSLKLNKGKTFYERSLIEQKMTQEIMGQQQIINFTLGTIQKADVIETDGQGNMRIRYTYLWSRVKQDGPMMNVDYDSAKQTTPPAGAEGFAALVGQSYSMRISPKGKVLDVNGVKEMAAAVRQKLPPDADPANASSPLASFLDEQAVREMTENAMAIYPEKPVEVGASWTTKQTMKRGMPMVAEAKLTLQKQEGGVATIGLTGTISPDSSSPVMDIQGMKMKVEMAGTQDSTMQMNEATGLVLNRKGKQDLKGQIKVGASAEGPFDMQIPMTMATTFTIDTSDKMWETKGQ